MSFRSVDTDDEALVCADVLGSFGVSTAHVRRQTGEAPDPEAAIRAALADVVHPTEFLRRTITAAPRGVELAARHRPRTLWTALGDAVDALGWTLDVRTADGRRPTRTSDPDGPWTVTLIDASGSEREATVDYPDTSLGRHNAPAIVHAVNERLLYGLDSRFVALSDGADRWRFAYVEDDELADLREKFGDRVTVFDRPLLGEHALAAFVDPDPGVDPYPDWATDTPRSAWTPASESAGTGTDPGASTTDAEADDTESLIDFVDDGAGGDGAGDDRAGGEGGASDRPGATTAAAASQDDEAGEDGEDGEDGASDADSGHYSDTFDGLSGWSAAEDTHGDDAPAWESVASGGRRTDEGRAGDTGGAGAGAGADGETDSGGADAAAAAPREFGGEMRTARTSDDTDAVDAAASQASTVQASPDAARAEEAADDGFFDSGLSGGPTTTRVESDSFGLPETQTEDEEFAAFGAAIDAGGGLSVTGLLDDEEFVPEFPAEGPTEVRVEFDDGFDPGTPPPSETRTTEDGFEWVNETVSTTRSSSD
jgi:hypothetical protein